MKTQYLFQSHTNSVLFEYDLNGLLVHVKIDSEDVEKAHQWIQKNLFFDEHSMKARIKHPTMKHLVSVVPADTSFEAFWNYYNYKKGKVESEKAYNKLSEADRAAAILGVKKYQKSVQKDGTAIVYPERYIKRRYWEDEWE